MLSAMEDFAGIKRKVVNADRQFVRRLFKPLATRCARHNLDGRVAAIDASLSDALGVAAFVRPPPHAVLVGPDQVVVP